MWFFGKSKNALKIELVQIAMELAEASKDHVKLLLTSMVPHLPNADNKTKALLINKITIFNIFIMLQASSARLKKEPALDFYATYLTFSTAQTTIDSKMYYSQISQWEKYQVTQTPVENPEGSLFWEVAKEIASTFHITDEEFIMTIVNILMSHLLFLFETLDNLDIKKYKY